jgi:uncharacterized protein DUF4430
VRLRLAAIVVASAALAAGAAGCGLGAGGGTGDVTVNVTRDFGARPLQAVSERQVAGSETVMRLLERHFTVTTRYGGGFVQSIAGAAGDGAQRDWFFYVNGIEAGHGAAVTPVYRGDQIWWDLHDWSQTQSVPAVVGSFPEPFVNGIAGKHYPTVVECGNGEQAICDGISTALHAYGVKAPQQLLGTGSGTDSLGILVGTWSQLEPLVAARLIDKGPSSGGVYAHFSGGSLQLLDPRGRVGRTLGAGAGLVAATRDAVAQPVWVVTGTDSAGVRAAAAALTPARLHDHFALAVQGGHDIPVPVATTG